MAAPSARSSPRPSADRAKRIEAARAFAIEAARLCADRRCRDVTVLDVTGLSPVCDFFLIATGTSDRQMKSVAVEVEEAAQMHDLRPMQSVRRGEINTSWIAIDLVDVVVHLLSEESRAYYDLDNLWGDARQVQWFSEGETKPPAEGADEASR